ncbi:hypothetical protein [Streptomyces lushanensis]|uniref:hypothetical protein n=1 Tax=Streptomyces lushanensis TaxID=1434255 RepID=UPI000829A3A9|nr:hypothetical protein [Streptomyces lushanensis]
MRVARRSAAAVGGLVLGGALAVAPVATAGAAAATFDECVAAVSPNAQETEKEAPGSRLVEAGCESGTEGGARAHKECAGLLAKAGVTAKAAAGACSRAALD